MITPEIINTVAIIGTALLVYGIFVEAESGSD